MPAIDPPGLYARRGFSLFSRHVRLPSKGLRVAAEGSSIGPWERTAQTDQDRTNDVQRSVMLPYY